VERVFEAEEGVRIRRKAGLGVDGEETLKNGR